MNVLQGIFAGEGNTRPLKDLTKSQLLDYPKADPSDEARWNCAKEIIYRCAEYTDHNRAVVKCREAVDRAERRSQNAGTASDREFAARALTAARKALALSVQKLEAEAAKPYSLSAAEVARFYQAENLPAYNEALRQFKAGALFTAWSYGWASYIAADAATVDRDRKTWSDFEGLAILAQTTDTKEFHEVRDFYLVRVSMPVSGDRGRRRFRQPLDEMDATTAAEYWRAWYAFNLATLRNGWPDDSGTAYDDRCFDPNKPGGRPNG